MRQGRLQSPGAAHVFQPQPDPASARQWDDRLLAADPPHFLQHVASTPTAARSCWNWPSLPPSPLEQIEKLEQLRVLAAGHTILVSVIDEPTVGIDTMRTIGRLSVGR